MSTKCIIPPNRFVVIFRCLEPFGPLSVEMESMLKVHIPTLYREQERGVSVCVDDLYAGLAKNIKFST